MLMLLVLLPAGATSRIQTSQASSGPAIRRSVVRAVVAGAVLLVLLLLLLLVMLTIQHIRPNGTSNQTTQRAQRTTTHLVTQKRAAYRADKRGAEAALTFSWASRASWSSLSAILIILASAGVAALLMLIIVMILVRWRSTTVSLALGRVRRLSAIMVVALVVGTWWRGTVGRSLVGGVSACWVSALFVLRIRAMALRRVLLALSVARLLLGMGRVVVVVVALVGCRSLAVASWNLVAVVVVAGHDV